MTTLHLTSLSQWGSKQLENGLFYLTHTNITEMIIFKTDKEKK